IFNRAGQIGMPRPRAFEIFQPFELVVLVDYFQRDRAAERDVLPNTTFDFDRVGFNTLPASAAVASLAAAKLDVDRRSIDRDAGWKAIDQRHNGFAMRLAGGKVT